MRLRAVPNEVATHVLRVTNRCSCHIPVAGSGRVVVASSEPFVEEQTSQATLACVLLRVAFNLISAGGKATTCQSRGLQRPSSDLDLGVAEGSSSSLTFCFVCLGSAYCPPGHREWDHAPAAAGVAIRTLALCKEPCFPGLEMLLPASRHDQAVSPGSSHRSGPCSPT